MKHVVIAMSGGVDSSLSALLLKQRSQTQGFKLTALFMRNWKEHDREINDKQLPCPADQDFADVARVCEQLDIPYYSVNFEKEYWDLVFTQFLSQYKLGLTPNPDILCNREIKFKLLWEKAQLLGADTLATGHYCQTIYKNGQWYLCRGRDSNKDQSYFLHEIDPAVLKHVLFPIGSYEKKEVRALAKQHHLSTSEKKDSTGICFIGKRNFRQFLSHYIPAQEGQIVDTKGNILGTHMGVAFYTIGQRKGLEIGGAGEAWFVIDKIAETNQLIVSQGETSKELFSQSCTILTPHWLCERARTKAEKGLSCQAKIRYRSPDCLCTVKIDPSNSSETFEVHFDEPQKAVTPGQSIVFYHKELCLGGAVIKSRSRENL